MRHRAAAGPFPRPLPRRALAAAALLIAALATGPARAAEVEVTLDRFGVGGAYRPGSFVAVRFLLEVPAGSGLGQVTTAWVQWEVGNADGDIGEYGRSVTLTRGQPRSVWLYAPLDPRATASTVWPVRVFQYAEGRRGREIGGVRISPNGQRVNGAASMIGVIGPSQMGLSQLQRSTLAAGEPVYTASEDTRLVFGIPPRDLCDRWYGLRCFEAIAWAGASPGDLGSSQAEALREWVRRGGHLVVSLPEDTNPWGLGERGQTELDDLLPPRAPRKDEDATIQDLLPVLCKSTDLLAPDLPFRLSLHVFGDRGNGEAAIGNHYEPLIALPDGRVVAVQRPFGHGRITILGIDLANRNLLRSIPLANGRLVSLPQADVFWSRILGRRDDTPTGAELADIDQKQRLARGIPAEVSIGDGRAFRQAINMSGPAGTGLVMAMVLFMIYWVAAGPGGYAVLNRFRRVHHAWLAFAAAAGVFTALAWGGVNLLRRNEVTVRHVTFLDHVARPVGSGGSGPESWGENDPQLQRASAWLSLYMPGYGKPAVGIESLDATPHVPAQRDLLVSWTPPRDSAPKFPNADRYVVDVGQSLDDAELPSRSTATQLYANWLGGLDRTWGGLLREDPNDPIRLSRGARGQPHLRGSIVNGLPGDLSNVKIIWIWNSRVPMRRYARQDGRETSWIRPLESGEMLNNGRMFALSGIAAGSTLVLPDFSDAQYRIQESLDLTYVREFESSSGLPGAGSPLTRSRQEKFLEMLGLYRQLSPPKYLRAPEAANPDTMAALRFVGRELDLSPWFVRPCLIVTGFLYDSACPIPLRVDGRTVQSEGMTIVRWIYPLPIDPAVAFPPPDQRAAAGR